MEDKRPSRIEDNKVVMSKISRDEFANLQKICKMEGKAINKKLRELIQHEIARVFRKAIKISGEKKKFFVPSENRFVEMVEVKEE